MTAKFNALPTAKFDVIIVGGGFTGGTLAVALAQAGLACAVVDGQAPERQTLPDFDGRASAIAAAPKRLLECLGIWEGVAAQATPIEEIRVADGASPLFLHYEAGAIGAEALGAMVENRHLRRAVHDKMAATAGITVHAPARAAALTREAGGAALGLADGTVLAAPLVVGADGRGSWAREASGIPLVKWTYDQVGIVCTACHARSHGNVAHEHFLPAGPFAILPITDNRSSIVWTEHAHLASTMLALGDAEFTAELTERFGDFLGPLEVAGPRWSYPLALQYAERTIDHRLALVGDAAQAMHPIAGQGLNLGLRDVAALAEVVVEAARLGLDLGSAGVLGRYRRWRRFDAALMLAATDGLNRLFSNDIGPLRRARDLGLAAVDRSGPLKSYFMRHAMGEAGDLPRLLTGEAL